MVKPSEVTPLSSFILAEIIDSLDLPAGVFNLVTGFGPGRRRGDRRPRWRRHGLVHGLDPCRAPRQRGGVGDGQAGRPRARRQVGERDPRRRGPEDRRRLRGRQLLPQLRPDLQRPHADAGSAREAGRGRGGRGRGRRERPRRAIRSRTARGLGRWSRRPSRSASAATSRRARRRARSSSRAAPSRPRASRRGYFVRPTVFSEVKPDMTIAQEEIFGPVLSIIPYDSEDEAAEIANGTIYGLDGGVWSADPERAKAFARRMRTGQVQINGATFNPLAPFGGYKQSGHGREYGRFGLEEFLEVKSHTALGTGALRARVLSQPTRTARLTDYIPPAARSYSLCVATAAKTVEQTCREAKDASHQLARASRDEKDACLRDLADRIDASAEGLLEANRADVDAGREEGLNEALLDRLDADRGADRRDGEGRSRDRRAGRSGRRGGRGVDARERAGGREEAGSDRRRGRRLRGAAERDDRCRGALPEERQCGRPARLEQRGELQRVPGRA